MPGTLYICATPIGNMEDITLRALKILEQADIIACEDTRQSMKLLGRYEIKAKLVSYHAHNMDESGAKLVDRLMAGDCVALVTDAGTPGVSDPGGRLAALCREQGISVVPIPGASAITAALSVFDCGGDFHFTGFLPLIPKKRRQKLQELSGELCPVIIYEGPHRLVKTLKDIDAAFGDRKLFIARELTKIYEECYDTTIKEALARWEEAAPKGEFVLIICPGNKEEVTTATPQELYHGYVAQGLTHMEAVKATSKSLGMPKREVYNIALNEKNVPDDKKPITLKLMDCVNEGNGLLNAVYKDGQRPLIIGLTGQTGSGKSYVAAMLEAEGGLIIDADEIAHRVLKENENVKKSIQLEFGNEVLTEQGEINRKALGNIIFTNVEKKVKLEKITHSVIIEEIIRQLEKFKENCGSKSFAVLDAPLLTESGLHEKVDNLWLVVAPKALRLKRIMGRDRITKDEALIRMDAQTPVAVLEKYADVIIQN